MPHPDTKLAKLLQLMADEEWATALHFAVKFPQLGDHKKAITRAHDIILRPDTYIQMGYDPKTTIATGIQALKDRYAKPYQETIKMRAKA